MTIIKYLRSLLVFVFLVVSYNNAQSQHYINIVEATDTFQGSPCPVPLDVEFYMRGNVSTHQFQDSLDIKVYFGDGTDTIFKTPIIIYFISWFEASFNHTYEYPGSYTVQYIVADSTYIADTVTVPNEVFVGDSCGNVSGIIYVDENSNCQYESGEPVYGNQMVTISSGGNNIAWDFTDQNGVYNFDLPTGGVYTASIGNNIPGVTLACPPSGSLTINSIPSTGNNIGVECMAGFDATGFLASTTFIPGRETTVYVCPRNLRCLPVSGQVMMVVDNPLLDVLSANPTPDYINGDTLVWDYTNMIYTDYVTGCFEVQLLTDSTATIGDIVCMDMIITPQVGDEVPSNNVETYCFEVRASYDPNDKAVTPAGIGAEGAILNNQIMTYQVRFQNTGTAPAANVYILDTLDANLDINTFRVLGSSHPMDLHINGEDKIKFDFPNIWLPDSTSNEPESHGFVIYSIEQKANLTQGTEIVNTAHIYFDYNEPVVTNTVLNTIDLTISVEENGVVVPLNVSIYPNPANDIVNIQSDKHLENATITLMDVSGRVVDTQIANGTSFQLYTGGLSAGVYTMVLDSRNNELVRRKIVLVK